MGSTPVCANEEEGGGCDEVCVVCRINNQFTWNKKSSAGGEMIVDDFVLGPPVRSSAQIIERWWEIWTAVWLKSRGASVVLTKLCSKAECAPGSHRGHTYLIPARRVVVEQTIV